MATLILRSSCAPLSGGATATAGHNRNIMSNKGDNMLDYRSLPIACDVTILPRVTVIQNNNNDENSSFVKNDNEIVQLRTLRIPNQQFLPCGMNNIITIDQEQELHTTTSTTAGIDNGGNHDGANYLLSLTNCVVNIDTVDNSSITLPVTAVPSTIQFSFHGGNEELDENDNVYNIGGGNFHRVGEIHSSFDFSTAVEYYNDNIRKFHREREERDTCNNSMRNSNNVTTSSSSWNNNNMHTDNVRSSTKENEVASIMLSLEEESRFIKRTLAALGCMGVVFSVALVWTLSKMSNKKSRRRRVIVGNKEVWRYAAVPHEIGAIKRRAMANTVASGDDKNEESTKTDVGQNHAVHDDEISPLTVVEDVATSTAVDNDKMANHETLRLISPFTPPLAADSNKQQDGVCNDSKKSSPRHWVSFMAYLCFGTI